MDSARQAVRWTVPGLVFTLGVLGLHSLWHTVALQKPISHIAASIHTSAWVGIFAAGIPIGFFIYQVYFRVYRAVGGWPWSWPAFYLRRDRGGFVLNHYRNTFRGDWDVVKDLIPGIPDEKLKNALKEVPRKQRLWVFDTLTSHICDTGTPDLNCEFRSQTVDQPSTAKRGAAWRCLPCAEEYRRRHDLNWTLFTSLLDKAERSGGAGIKIEYTVGSDIYHGLGAARTAVMAAFLCSLAYQGCALLFSIHTAESCLHLTGAFLAEIVAFIGAYLVVFHQARRNATLPYLKRVAANLGSTYRKRELSPPNQTPEDPN